MENIKSQKKRSGFVIEILFAVLVFLYTCPLIPFLMTFIHPRFIMIYIAFFIPMGLLAVILLIISIVRLITQSWKQPKEFKLKSIIIVFTIIIGFLMHYSMPWWDAAAQGMYLNLKSENFNELRNWAQSLQIPEDKNYLRLTTESIPSVVAKFKPIYVWISKKENSKEHIVSVVWCGGMSHVSLIVGPPDMNIPEADMRPDHVEVHKIISPGVYISIGE
jgi:hypothetical protein